MSFAEIVGNVEMWLGYFLTLISLISTVFAICEAIKSKKFSEIRNHLMNFIKEAETFTCKNGQSVDGKVKKEIVLSRVQTLCSQLKFKYDEETWSNLVDSYVNLTLSVNQRPQDKTKLAKQDTAQPTEVY